MPRSKLGLDLSVKQLLRKGGLNPTSKMIELIKATDKESKEELELKGPYLKLLVEYQHSKPKSHVAKQPGDDGNVQVIRQTYVLPKNDEAGS